jgi:hypothetical protein
MREFRSEIIKQKPGLSSGELVKELGRVWRDELDEDTKKRFNSLAKRESEMEREKYLKNLKMVEEEEKTIGNELDAIEKIGEDSPI